MDNQIHNPNENDPTMLDNNENDPTMLCNNERLSINKQQYMKQDVDNH